ncbi:MAG: TlpA family protein disulfide reductase [Flavobacteriales bacterium]|nr:MAG: TlpA family protein disulfide reductase [Flavobacteriales bacterium]
MEPEKVAKVTDQYEDLEGQPVALADYKGKKVLLNYWATWCRPCIEEMPSLLRSQALLQNENFVVLLASDQSVETIKKFKQARGFDFTYLKFNGSMAQLGINALPVTFIYNEAGEQVEKILGGVDWDAPETIQMLKKIR